jgi:Replicative DNA helicase
MALSAPLYYLKRKARLLSRKLNIPLHEALDCVAREEGFMSWSLLSDRVATATEFEVLDRFRPGDLVLIGARPGQGKTMTGLHLAVTAARQGRSSTFFTLAYSTEEVDERLRRLGVHREDFGQLFELHVSDGINADYIVQALALAPEGSVAVVDYLQALDHRRTNPDILMQVRSIREMAKSRGVIIAFISQIDHSFDASGKSLPDLADIRLPNPLDLDLFDQSLFMHKGQMRLSAA